MLLLLPCAGRNTVSVGFVSAIPWVFGVVAMYLVARSADSKGERRWPKRDILQMLLQL